MREADCKWPWCDCNAPAGFTGYPCIAAKIPAPRTDTERLDALEKGAKTHAFTHRSQAGRPGWAVWPWDGSRYVVEGCPTLRAAIDAYLDAEQQSEQRQ